jgi:calcium/calmodulin-dependent protein kinase I
MEILEGGELFDRIVKKSFYNEKDARDLVYILINAIKYCHDRGIVHRDLKPENLLLKSVSDDADIKLADFGFAVRDSDNKLKDKCGTPLYMAPEIFVSETYGKSVDMWSIGVIAYILLGGSPPFHDQKVSRLYKKIINGKYDFNSIYWNSVSNDAKDFISKLLVIDPLKRLTAELAMQHTWLTKNATELACVNLTNNLLHFRKYFLLNKFKSAVNAVSNTTVYFHSIHTVFSYII